MSKLVEEWKDIEGYEGLYQVSDWGNVRNRHGKLIAKELSNGGYYRVHLWKNGVSEHLLIHRLVAEAFIPNPENKPCVGHLKPLPDGTEDKTANEVWYLQWMTYSENSNYGTNHERKSNSQINDANKSKPINVYSYENGTLLYHFPSIKEANRKLGVNNVQKVIRKIYKQEKGYTFEYA
jgi:hypothetical protein